MSMAAKEFGCHTQSRQGCDGNSLLEVLLPHSRKAARGVITRGVVAVVGGVAVTFYAGERVIKWV